MTQRTTLAAAVAAMALFAADATVECPRWISIMPLATNDAEAVAADAAKQGEETVIDGIAWNCSIHPMGDPAADLAGEYAKAYRAMSPLVRAKSNVKQGLLLQSTMGHGGFPGKATPWQLSVKPDGSSVYRMCPLDERFLDYIAKACRTFSALKPDFFMIDDDTRIVWDDAAPGCFCPLHLAAFSKATGREWTREEVVRRLKARDPAVLPAWEKVKFESLERFFRTIRRNFSPEIPGILCTVRSPAHLKHVHEFAGILATDGQTPTVRGGGGHYCGNDLFHAFIARSNWAAQLRKVGPGLVYLQEADTCPQTLWSCSASREFENMAVQALEGVRGAKIWITRLSLTRERRSQAAYLRKLAENRGILEWAAHTEFRQRGAVLAPREAPDGFAERYLALVGIPYRYGDAREGEVRALCAGDLRRMKPDEIEAALAGPLLIDGSAAIWLSEKGYSADIGVRARPWARRTVQSHVTADGAELGGMRVDASVADLTDRNGATTELSRLRNVPFKGATPEYEAPGSLEFRNSRGGRVISFALPLRSNRPPYYQATMFSEGYKEWIAGLLSRLAGGVIGGAYFAGAGAVMCEVGSTAADGDVFVLDPIDVDDLFEPEMRFERIPSSIERLCGDGKWRAVDFERIGDGLVRLKTTVQAKTPTAFRYR